MLGHGNIDFLRNKLDFDIRIDAAGPGALLTPLYKLFEYHGEGSSDETDLASETVLKNCRVLISEFRNEEQAPAEAKISNQQPEISNSPRCAHVDRGRGASRDRASALDRVQRDADFREEQHAVVRATVHPRRDRGLPGSSATRRARRGFRACQLPDQSRRDQSAVSRQLPSRLVRGADPRGSVGSALCRSAPGRAPRRGRGSRVEKGGRVDQPRSSPASRR